MSEERFEMTTTKGDSSPIKYTKKEIDLIKSIHAKGATDDEFKLMIHLSKEYGLNILQKHIWLIKMGNYPALIFVGRDGYLDIAHRSGFFNGLKTEVKKIDEGFSKKYTATEWKDGQKKKVNKEFKVDSQFVATCTVWRKDSDHPIEVTVYEEEYSTGRDNWETKRRTMIGKVSESQALRKAFSVSGVYAPEEVDLSEPPVTPEYSVVDLPKRSEINKMFNPENCTTKEDWKEKKEAFIKEFGAGSLSAKTGHNEFEVYENIMNIAWNRIEGVNPIDTRGPEDLVSEFLSMVENCSDADTYKVISDMYDNNPALQTNSCTDAFILLQSDLQEKGTIL